MESIFDKDKNFKAAVGGFIVEFSKLESGLTVLDALTEFDLPNYAKYLPKYWGLSFEQKKNILTDFIKDQLPELNSIWQKLKQEMEDINKERRFIVHGFANSFIPKGTITTYIHKKGKIEDKELDINTIKKLTNRLRILLTGDNGINGEFHNLFIKTRIDKWNIFASDKYKIVYEVNNKIISEWKGV